MDSFDYAKKRLSNRERVTHTYHPRNGPTSYNQLDAILVNKNASELVLDAKVYRYKNKLGEKRPLPSSYAERELNPSDHFPVVLKLDLSHLNR